MFSRGGSRLAQRTSRLSKKLPTPHTQSKLMSHSTSRIPFTRTSSAPGTVSLSASQKYPVGGPIQAQARSFNTGAEYESSDVSTHPVVITSQDQFTDRQIAYTVGPVFGSIVRTRHIFADLFAYFRMIIGGEIGGYTRLLMESREEAMSRLKQSARAMGADGVVTLRFSTTSMQGGVIEVLVYGTAVKLGGKRTK